MLLECPLCAAQNETLTEQVLTPQSRVQCASCGGIYLFGDAGAGPPKPRMAQPRAATTVSFGANKPRVRWIERIAGYERQLMAAAALAIGAWGLFLSWPVFGPGSGVGPVTVQVRGPSPQPNVQVASLLATPYPLGNGQLALVIEGELKNIGLTPQHAPSLLLTWMSRTVGTSVRARAGYALDALTLSQTTDLADLQGRLAGDPNAAPLVLAPHGTLPLMAIIAPWEPSHQRRWLVADWAQN